jgi:hypothetical protein
MPADEWVLEEYKFDAPERGIRREVLAPGMTHAAVEQLVRDRFRNRYRQGADLHGVRVLTPMKTTYFKRDYYDLMNEGPDVFASANRARRESQQRGQR